MSFKAALVHHEVAIPIPPQTVIPSEARDLGVCRARRYRQRKQEPRSLASLGV